MTDTAPDPALEKLRERLTDVLESNDTEVVIEAPRCLEAASVLDIVSEAAVASNAADQSVTQSATSIAHTTEAPMPPKPRGWLWTMIAFLIGGLLAFVFARLCVRSPETDVADDARTTRRVANVDDARDETDDDNDTNDAGAPPKLTAKPPAKAVRPDARVAQRVAVTKSLEEDTKVASDDPLFQPL